MNPFAPCVLYKVRHCTLAFTIFYGDLDLFCVWFGYGRYRFDPYFTFTHILLGFNAFYDPFSTIDKNQSSLFPLRQ